MAEPRGSSNARSPEFGAAALQHHGRVHFVPPRPATPRARAAAAPRPMPPAAQAGREHNCVIPVLLPPPKNPCPVRAKNVPKLDVAGSTPVARSLVRCCRVRKLRRFMRSLSSTFSLREWTSETVARSRRRAGVQAARRWAGWVPVARATLASISRPNDGPAAALDEAGAAFKSRRVQGHSIPPGQRPQPPTPSTTTLHASVAPDERYPVAVPAQGPQGWLDGTARVDARAVIRRRGVVIDTPQWTRAVTVARP